MSNEISLQSLCEGAAGELFDLELQKLNDNIADPNTDPKIIREVVLKVRFRPDENRERAAMEVGVTLKLAPRKGHGALAWFGKDNAGRQIAVENNPNQGTFKFAQDGVTPINQKKGEVVND